MKPTDVVELRVHGVSGTPPEELIGRSAVVRVAGNRTVGFHRPEDADQRTDDVAGAPLGSGPYLEGYNWGGLTSGAAARALWLLLLPFTLANVTLRMRPAAVDPDNPNGAAAAGERVLGLVLRLFGLSLTGTLLLGVCGVSLDLVGWQCGSPRATALGSCAKLPRLLAFVLPASLHAGQRIAIAALLPTLLLLLLWYLAAHTARRYERQTAGLPAPSGVNTLSSVRLAATTMWRGQPLVGRLRSIHIGVGAATIAAVTAGAVLPIDRAYDAASPIFGWLVVGFALTVVALGVGALFVPAVVTQSPSPAAATFTRWLRRTSWLTLVASAWYAAWPRSLDHGSWYAGRGGLPLYAGTITWLFAIQAILLAIVLGLLLFLHSSAAESVPLGGTLGWIFSLLALLIAVSFSAGLYFLVAARLHYGGSLLAVFAEKGAAYYFRPPSTMRAAAGGFLLAMVVAVVAAAIAFFVVRSIAHEQAVPEAALPSVVFASEPAIVTPPPAAAVTVARLIDHASAVLAAAVFAGLVPVALVLADLVLGRRTSVHLLDALVGVLPDRLHFTVARLQQWGAGVIVYFALGLVVLGYLTYRTATLRRTVGILWDLGSFWPRSAHPLAAPCYAERAVPELVNRLRWYVDVNAARSPADDYPHGGVVLTCHSQGTVIGAAALLQLAGDPQWTDESRVAFVSYGCVLRRLYARFYPAYFGLPVLSALAGTTNWTNLWRSTDYLGGPVTWGPPYDPSAPGPITTSPAMLGVRDLRLRDPLVDPALPAVERGDVDAPTPGRHSNFPADPVFARTVNEVAAALTPSVVGAAGPGA
jgi:hypothetical protein